MALLKNKTLSAEHTASVHRQRYRSCEDSHPFWVFYWQWKEKVAAQVRYLIGSDSYPQPKIGYNAYAS